MVTEYVMTGGRGSGKTYASMTEIHQRILDGDRPVVLVVFPERYDVEWWYEMWNSRFPHIPMPSYTSLENTLGVSGRRWKYVYIEHADEPNDGWHNDKLRGTVLCNLSPDAEVVYIYDMNPWDPSVYAHTFSEYPPPAPSVTKLPGKLRRLFQRPKPELNGR